MALQSKQYVDTSKTKLLLDVDVDENGPYIPYSALSTIGAAIIAAATSSAARSILGAAASGSNTDITKLLGMSAASSYSTVVTPQGTVALSSLFSAMEGWGGSVRSVTEAATALSSDGVILADTDTAAFAITVPVALGQSGQTKVFFVGKSGSGTNPLIIQDDSDNIKKTLVTGGEAMALVIVAGGVVYTFGNS